MPILRQTEVSRLRLVDTFLHLRRNHQHKIVIIIDQFEQWLHAHRSEPDAELVQALRQCDGVRVQAIVMIRDDFAMAAARFMQALDVSIVQGQNFATVDLFEIDHAKNVLIKFGQSFGKLPANSENLSPEEQHFVTDVANGLAQDGKVVSVRLSLFAEMVKSKRWTVETLQAVGGTEGIGVNFLEETFSSPQANPRHRLHATAARAVLKSLLPELGTDIKGHMRSQQELLESSGYIDRPTDFTDLLRILDGELRLVTPTDPEGESLSGSSRDSSLATRYYQLTHDYLVPSLREWLTRKQRETRRGRAELKLEERSAIWNAKQENKQLPTVTEWLSIRTLSDSKRWTAPQSVMMRKAARVHGTLWGSVLLTLLVVGVGIQQWASAVSWASLQEQTRAAAESLQNNLGPTVPVNIKELKRLPETLVLSELQSRLVSATNASHKLSLAFALAGYGKLDADYLVSEIDAIAESDARNYVTALQANPTTALAALKAAAQKCSDKSLWRRKAKLAIASVSLGDAELAEDVCEFLNPPDPELRTIFIDEFPRWDIDLKSVLQATKNSDNAGLRSGICLAVGQVPVEQIIDADKESWQSIACQWFVEKGDSSTHSAAGWMLRRWGTEAPHVADECSISANRDWYIVKTNGATMLRMRPGRFHQLAESNQENKDREVEINSEFWVCDREVTRGQFEEFANDSNYPAKEKPAAWEGVTVEISPTADHPAQQVSWYDAVLYCNWLSQREGLIACYERTGTKEKGGYDETIYDAWRLVSGGTGYRLLQESEWEYACRAGTTTVFSSSDDETMLIDYCQMYPSKLTTTCGEKLPNAWGLHDVHGNVWEWCWDSYDESRGSNRVYRGGSWDRSAGYCRSAYRSFSDPSPRDFYLGFRLALSSPSVQSPEADK